MATIPHFRILMICRELRREGLRPLPEGYYMRGCEADEVPLWKELQAAPRDGASLQSLDEYFAKHFAPHGDLFQRSCRFLCGPGGEVIGSGFIWKPEGQPTLLHWIKVLEAHEGKGLGRAIISELMLSLAPQDYPVFLHTQPASYRAVKLYSDLGYDLVAAPFSLDGRTNELEGALGILREHMRPQDARALRIAIIPHTGL